MNNWISLSRVVAAGLWGALLPGAALANTLYRVTNVSPYPSLTNEFYLTATNTTTTIHGTNVQVNVYKDDPPGGGGAPAQIPGPVIELNVGQTVICHFRNALTNNIEGASIHWHGIELDNDSDGTAVQQDTILPGQTYTYRYIVPRGGLYWYHSHMLPGTTTFGGMYGAIIVHDTNEAALIAANVLPPTNMTFQIIMTDISFTNGVVGKVMNGTNYSLNSLIQMCENEVLGVSVNSNRQACGIAGPPGDVFLCNGSVPILAGTACAPTASSTPIFYVGKNQRVRLQFYNDSISRNGYLTLRYPCSNPTGNTNLYHIGGQGGLLDYAVLDGGVQSGYNFQYSSGTVNLGSGQREDVMFYTSGSSGDVIQLVGNPLGPPWNLSGSFAANYPVAFFVVTNPAATNTPIYAGMPILTAIGASNEDLKVLYTNSVAPPPLPAQGAQSGVITLMNNKAANGVDDGPNISGYAATALDGNSGDGSFPDVPHPPTAVWTRAGDVLQLAIANETGTDGGGGAAAHPYHLHGFSMQPVAIYSSNLQTNLFNWPYNEFLDTMDIVPGQALVFRIHLTDRPRLADTATGGPLTLGTDAPTGGNVGRWLMHCHIFLHGTIGMISELVVVANSTTRLVGSSAGTNSVILIDPTGAPWTNTVSVPWLHLASGYASGSGGTTVLFTYDANPGGTRTGTVNVAGETVLVTQAGTNYVQAPGPVTALVSNGISGPSGIAVDGAGNVYFGDSNDGAIKEWVLAEDSVTTLVSGLGLPQGLALDRLGNVYFADFYTNVIRMWSASTHTVTKVFTNTTTGISGLAVDSSGNVYITVPSQNLVKEWYAPSGPLENFLTNGLNAPYGVAVDVADNVYVADTYNNAVKEFEEFFIFGSPVFFWSTVISSNYLNMPWNLAVDDGGNLYVADGSDNAIKRWSYASNSVSTLISSGLSTPTDVAVDGAGNVYVSDYGHSIVKELPYAFVDPTPKHEGANSALDSLSPILPTTENLLPPFTPTPNASWISYYNSTNGVVNFDVGANLGGPRSGTLTVMGQPITINQDGSSAGVATTNLLVGPAAGSNTVSEFVIPSISLWSASTTTPWLHLPYTSGTGSGNVLFNYDANAGATRVGTLTINTKPVTVTQAGSTYIQAPGPLSTLVGSGLVAPVGVAVDGTGDVIISDSGNNTVSKWMPGRTTASNVFTNGLSIPQFVGVDPSGNIYVADFSDQAIKEWQAASSNLITFVSTSPYNPIGLSLGYGTNVYWSDGSDIYEWITANDEDVTVVSSNLTSAYGIDVDVAGNVYIADTYANAIKEYNPITQVVSILATNGINTPWDVAVDGSGNVYVANGSSNNIVKWVAASGSLVTVVPSGISEPTGVKVDASQNVYIADYGDATVKELPYAFIDPTTRFEPANAGSDALPVVLPPGQNLSAQFAPTASNAWLSITSTNGGVVSFTFTANTNIFARTNIITLLGRGIAVVQAAVVYPPLIVHVSVPSNGVFQLSFTNGTPGATYDVLMSTNVMNPWTNWTVIGSAMLTAPNLWQFTDHAASNRTRFYRVRSP